MMYKALFATMCSSTYIGHHPQLMLRTRNIVSSSTGQLRSSIRANIYVPHTVESIYFLLWPQNRIDLSFLKTNPIGVENSARKSSLRFLWRVHSIYCLRSQFFAFCTMHTTMNWALDGGLHLECFRALIAANSLPYVNSKSSNVLINLYPYSLYCYSISSSFTQLHLNVFLSADQTCPRWTISAFVLSGSFSVGTVLVFLGAFMWSYKFF